MGGDTWGGEEGQVCACMCACVLPNARMPACPACSHPRRLLYPLYLHISVTLPVPLLLTPPRSWLHGCVHWVCVHRCVCVCACVLVLNPEP